MRCAVVGLFLTVLASSHANAIGDLAALSSIQTDCAQVGEVSYGEHGRWAECAVTRGRWVATIGLEDMYQAQYCLGKSPGVCDQRAITVFGNRAYTPMARLLLQRIDPKVIEYDDPLVVKNQYGRILMISSRRSDETKVSDYYLWSAGRWVPIDSKLWLRKLAKRLPDGVKASEEIFPDILTMSASVKLVRTGDHHSTSAAGVANLEFGLADRRFLLKQVVLNKGVE